jgi:hypothetical protein
MSSMRVEMIPIGVQFMGDAGRQRRERGQLLLLAGCLLECASLADIGDQGHRQQAVRGLDRREANLNGELTAVLALAEEIEPQPHGSRPRSVEVVSAVPAMRGPEALGQELLDELAEELVLRVAEHRFAASIGSHDPPGHAHDQDPLGRALEKGARRLDLRRQRVGGGLHVGDVDRRADVPSELVARLVAWSPAVEHPSVLSIRAA